MDAAGAGNGAASGYSSQITFTVVMSCLMAASGGLIFGYDISITGQSCGIIVLEYVVILCSVSEFFSFACRDTY